MIDIAIDIGGTFTDVVCLENGEKLYATKVSSTPKNIIVGIERGIEKILHISGHSFKEIRTVLHGTTVATNTIIEQKGAKLGILMTKGFEDVLEIGRQQRALLYDLNIDVQTPIFLAPRRMRKGITERVAANGQVVTELDEDEVIRTVATLKKKYNVDAIAVCYLFSFINPAHEIRTREIIQKEYPGITISLSSELNPIFREYERLCVTAFDAYVKPVVERYIEQLEDSLKERSIEGNAYLIQSSGGLTKAIVAAEKPVNMILSGPTAGVLGGKLIGDITNFKNAIIMDMGGTSFDVSLISEGRRLVSREGMVCGYPLRTPMIDVNTIGAGGGSIAWLDSVGGLRVGPHSAGADPGPACYGYGGKEPTATDASVILGYLNPDYFAGGDMVLDKEAAVKAMEKIAQGLGMDLISTAYGVHRILNSMMADETRLITIRRGYDPRKFALIAGGAAGPVHAGALAQILSIPTVIVPEEPGVLSAFGLLNADLRSEQSQTLPMELDSFDFEKADNLLLELDRLGKIEMERYGIFFKNVNISRFADMRYAGQSFELEVPIPDKITPDNIVKIKQEFTDVSRQAYGQMGAGTPIEFITFRSVYIYNMPKTRLKATVKGRSEEEAIKERRDAYFGDGYVSTPVYDRTKIETGRQILGPAIIEQAGTTTVLYPNQSCYIDDFNNIIVDALGKSTQRRLK